MTCKEEVVLECESCNAMKSQSLQPHAMQGSHSLITSLSILDSCPLPECYKRRRASLHFTEKVIRLQQHLVLTQSCEGLESSFGIKKISLRKSQLTNRCSTPSRRSRATRLHRPPMANLRTLMLFGLLVVMAGVLTSRFVWQARPVVGFHCGRLMGE
jgi:hypothetical protein